MQQRQRTVVVVATGLALAVVALTVNRLLDSHAGGGWFAYAPNTGVIGPGSSDTPIWREAGVWLAAIAIWTGIALWLYRSRSTD